MNETHRAAALAALLTAVAACPAALLARPLAETLPGLFGGRLCRTVQAGVCEKRQLRGLERFRSLSAILRSAYPPPPVPSASGAFRFVWDPTVDTFVRYRQSLGSGLAERAPTLGRGVVAGGFAYTHTRFDTFEGDPLDRLTFTEPAVPGLLAGLPPGDRERFADDVVRTELDIELESDLFFVWGAYGITDTVDASLALAFGHVRLGADVEARIEDGDGAGDAVFVIEDGGELCRSGGRKDLRCARDRLRDSATGTGDVFLRAKWRFWTWRRLEAAAAGVLTIPTGNAGDFLGFHDPTFTPWIILSLTHDRLSPHLNLGYAFRSGKDVSQAQWTAGVDARATRWLTLAIDFLGFHDDHRDGLNDDVFQAAWSVKVNAWGKTVIGATAQVPLNRDGLRADVIPTVQIEQTF